MRNKLADLNAAYMANRPLAMCNQLTGCGKPHRRTMKWLIVKAFQCSLPR